MTIELQEPLAKTVVEQITSEGFEVIVDEIPRKLNGIQTGRNLPGITLLARRAGSPDERIHSVSVRDFSRARAELEAACLLANRIGVKIAA